MNIAAVATSLTTSSTQRITDQTRNTAIEQASTQELQQIKQLKARDNVVRAHEMAHITAGHGLTRGNAQFSFQRGPDGIQYAVGGEVQIDTSKEINNPQATLKKALQIQAAALAPLQPSSQDRIIAANAAQMAIEARAEIMQHDNDDKTTAHDPSDNNDAEASLDFKV